MLKGCRYSVNVGRRPIFGTDHVKKAAEADVKGTELTFPSNSVASEGNMTWFWSDRHKKGWVKLMNRATGNRWVRTTLVSFAVPPPPSSLQSNLYFYNNSIIVIFSLNIPNLPLTFIFPRKGSGRKSQIR